MPRQVDAVARGLRDRIMAGMNAIAVYLVGFGVLMTGLAYGAWLVHVPTSWIGVGCLVLMGLGIISAGARMRSGKG